MTDTKALTIHDVEMDVICRIRLLAVQHGLRYPELIAKAIQFFHENNHPKNPPDLFVQLLALRRQNVVVRRNSRTVTLYNDAPWRPADHDTTKPTSESNGSA